ncbi:MAG: protein-disulfide reductase DsbD domain-containing protein, partial [Planctomycetota bacterium]
MAQGGMYDQLGGGFHRYAVDETWTVPHFEKMLYDNGQLLSLYARSFASTQDPQDERIIRETIVFMDNNMTAPTGAFYSAIDAEVDHKEGLNYLWRPAEVRAALSNDKDREFALELFGVIEQGNFQDPHHPSEPRRNVLTQPKRDQQAAEHFNLSLDGFYERRDQVREAMLSIRDQRDQPSLDDKIIVSWNAIAIEGLADASIVLRDENILRRAERAADFILDEMLDADTNLMRIHRAGVSSTPAFLEDYAGLTAALLSIHRARASLRLEPELKYFRAAERLTNTALQRFGGSRGVLYDTTANQPDLLVRSASLYDGAIPSAQSIMLHNLLDFHAITREPERLQQAEALLRACSAEIDRSPIATINSVRALLRFIAIDSELPERLGPPREETPSPEAREQPLRVMASADRITIPETGETTLRVRLEIDSEYHINAFDAGHESLVPLSLSIHNGAGITARVEAPEPSKLSIAGIDANVYSGEVDLLVRLSRDQSEDFRGRPILVLEYQACTENACLAPASVELAVSIDQGW